MDEIKLHKEYHQFIDAIEEQMRYIGTKEFPKADFFCGGMYVRMITIDKGDYLTSKIHRLEHPFFLLKGKLTIFTEQGGEETVESPFIGVTVAGTRRFARCDEDAIWVTVHRTDKTTEAEVEDEIIVTRNENLLEEGTQ